MLFRSRGDLRNVPVWSPDGTQLAFSRDGDVWVVNANGGGLRKLTPGIGYASTEPQWDPLGRTTSEIGGTPVSPGVPTDSRVRNDVLETRHTIGYLSADGSRAVVAYGAGPNCVELWNVPARALTRFASPSDCVDEAPDGFLELVLAGTRVAWLTFGTGNHLYMSVDTASLLRPAPVGVQISCLGRSCAYAGEGDLQGDHSLLVFDTWQQRGGPCEDHTCFRQKKTNGTLWRIVGSRALRIRSEKAGLTALSVDAGKVAILRSDGSIELLRGDGSLVRAFSFRPGEVRGAELTGLQLVVQKRDGISVYDAGSGRLAHSFRVPRGGLLTDAQSGIAVYVAGRIVHLLRLVDGKDVAIRAPGEGSVHAQIEPPGLFYSYSAPGSPRPGRVAFVPFKTLLQLLGS